MNAAAQPDIIRDVKEAFSQNREMPFNDLIDQLTLMAENYERTISSLPRFWQHYERTSCAERAYGIREAISVVRKKITPVTK